MRGARGRMINVTRMPRDLRWSDHYPHMTCVTDPVIFGEMGIFQFAIIYWDRCVCEFTFVCPVTFVVSQNDVWFHNPAATGILLPNIARFSMCENIRLRKQSVNSYLLIVESFQLLSKIIIVRYQFLCYICCPYANKLTWVLILHVAFGRTWCFRKFLNCVRSDATFWKSRPVVIGQSPSWNFTSDGESRDVQPSTLFPQLK